MLFKCTQDLTIGKLEAEAELNGRSNIRLEDVFYDLIDIETFFEKENKFLLVGGKGTGKSSFARMYYKKSQDKYNRFCNFFTKTKFNFERVLQEIPSNQTNDYNQRTINQYLIEWIILNQLLNLIKQHEFIKTFKEYDKLIEFQNINRGIISIDEREVIESLTQFSGNVNVDALNAFIKANFGKNKTFKFKKAFFIKLIPDLKNTIKMILDSLNEYVKDENFYFTIIIDDLDHDLRNIQEHRDLLMDIIRIAKTYNVDFLPEDKIFLKIALLIRPDILSELSAYADSFKIIESYSEKINWYDYDMSPDPESKTHLRKLVNLRIAKVLKEFDGRPIGEDPWYDLVDKSVNSSGKSSFKFCLDHTRYRPRDVIILVNCLLKNMKENEKINSSKIMSSLRIYSNYLWKDIENELSFYFNYDELKKIEYILKKLLKFFSFSDIDKLLRDEGFKTFQPERLLELLFNSSVIGNNENGRYYFKHREEYEPYKINFQQEFIINNGLLPNLKSNSLKSKFSKYAKFLILTLLNI